MYEVLTLTPVIEEEPVVSRVRRTLNKWGPSNCAVKHRIHAKGQTPGSDHVFDSVAFFRESGRNTVAVKTLAPGYGPNVQARGYGFLALDLRGTTFDDWARLAVVAKVEQWPESALKMVRAHSAKTLEARSGEEDLIDRALPAYIEELATAA